MSTEQLFAVTKQLCTSVTAMHAMDIVHRDIKPHNVFLELPVGPDGEKVKTGYPRVAVADFNTAYKKGDHFSQSSAFDPAIATAQFASPVYFRFIMEVSAQDELTMQLNEGQRREHFEVSKKNDHWGVATTLLSLGLGSMPPWQDGLTYKRGDNILKELIKITTKEKVDQAIADVMTKLKTNASEHPQQTEQNELNKSFQALEAFLKCSLDIDNSQDSDCFARTCVDFKKTLC